jgi:RhtB (resistance to homoserine/threonine) family protein
MMGTQNFTLFVLSGALLCITPGQDTLYIVGRSVAQGRAAGLLSVLGICCGAAVHTLAAAFGLSAILATSASAFTIVKLIGACYLAYLGVSMWIDRSAIHQPTLSEMPRATSWQIFRAGMLTDLLNPKVALFYLAFLPQFVDPHAKSKVAVFIFLGATFIAIGIPWCIFVVLASSSISQRLRGQSSAAKLVRRATGGLFVGLGVKLAVSR